MGLGEQLAMQHVFRLVYTLCQFVGVYKLISSFFYCLVLLFLSL